MTDPVAPVNTSTNTKPRALLLSGGGRYGDPWHPFSETSEQVRLLLEESKIEVVVRTDVDTALAELVRPASWPDVLVVNVGLPRDGEPAPGSLRAASGLDDYLLSGRALVSLHSSATSFVDHAAWASAEGGRWVRGTTMHPDYGPATVNLRPHPLTEGLDDFDVSDERYSYLSVNAECEVLATHRLDGLEHPLIWVRERDERFGRAVYDGLGHDSATYASTTHRALIARLFDWVLH